MVTHRNDAADYEKQRMLQNAYYKQKEKEAKQRDRTSNPEKIDLVSVNRWLPAGSWSKKGRSNNSSSTPARAAKTKDTGDAGTEAPDDDKMLQMIHRAHRTWRQNAPLLYEMAAIQVCIHVCMYARSYIR